MKTAETVRRLSGRVRTYRRSSQLWREKRNTTGTHKTAKKEEKETLQQQKRKQQQKKKPKRKKNRFVAVLSRAAVRYPAKWVVHNIQPLGKKEWVRFSLNK